MLSVIIPCYNSAATIVVQLEALTNQQCSEPWEVIVSDNGSIDEIRLVVEQYRDRLPDLRVVDSSHRRGAGYARNIGVLAARGDKLAFCDSDDEVASGWVAAMSEALDMYDFVAGRLDPYKLNEAWTLKARQCPQQDGLQDYSYPPFLPHAAGCNLGIKRALHEAVGGFDESMLKLHDTDYCWRIQLAGTTFHFVPRAVVHYRFRHTMSGLYHQARQWGKYNVLLYKRYRPLGMSELSWKTGVKAWWSILRRLPRIRRREGWAVWLWKFAWRLGRLQGSIEYRVLAF